MTPEQAARLDKIRETVIVPALLRGRVKAIPVDAPPPKDEPPRYKLGPLAGKLKDRRARMEEELGMGDPEAKEWQAEALQDPKWRALYGEYEREFGEQVAAEKLAARTERGIEIAAKSLGLELEEFKRMQGDPARMKDFLTLERNAQIRDQIALLEAKIQPPPEVPEEPEP